MKYIILGQWLTCLFSMDLTIYTTQLLVNIFNAWRHLLPNWTLCPQMLLVTLSCGDAQVLQWDHTPKGVLHGWMVLCWLWLALHAVELGAASWLYIFKGINVCFSSALKAGGCLNQGNESADTKEYAVYYWGFSGFCCYCKTRHQAPCQ